MVRLCIDMVYKQGRVRVGGLGGMPLWEGLGGGGIKI